MAFTSGQILTAAQLNTFDPGTKITNAGGTAGAPTYTFNGDTDTGMFRTGADAVGIATGGTLRATFNSSGVTADLVGDVTGNLTGNVTGNVTGNQSGGSIAATTLTASGDANFDSGTLFVDVSEDKVGVGTTAPETPINIVTTNKLGSTFTGTVDGEGLRVDQSNYTADNYVSLVEASYQDDQTAPHVRMGAQFTSSGSKLVFGTSNSYGSGITNAALTINQTGIVTLSDELRVGSGSASDPAYTFDDDDNTGFYVTGNNGRIHFCGNGVEGGYLLSTGGRFIDGSAAAPSYAFRDDTDTGMYRSSTNEISFTAGNDTVFTINSGGVFVPSGEDYFGVPTTGTGNDAEWSSTGFGTFMLKRNSSLTAEKENITDDLGTYLTADMIDQVVPKLWNRKHTPGYPEIGPLAEDMDAISPFLAAHGADIRDGTYQEFVSGINKTAYLSLLVLAVKDLRSRVATLEAA